MNIQNKVLLHFLEKWNASYSEPDINDQLLGVKNDFFDKLKEMSVKHPWFQDVIALYRYALDPKANKFEKTGILLAILYLINPFDLIPDFTPILGFIDDGLIIAFLVSKLKEKVDFYRN